MDKMKKEKGHRERVTLLHKLSEFFGPSPNVFIYFFIMFSKHDNKGM